MEVISQSSSAEDLPRRPACDRCRGQKLRCERMSAGADVCRRCLKAGARCATTSTRGVGRPKAWPEGQNASYPSTRPEEEDIQVKDSSPVVEDWDVVHQAQEVYRHEDLSRDETRDPVFIPFDAFLQDSDAAPVQLSLNQPLPTPVFGDSLHMPPTPILTGDMFDFRVSEPFFQSTDEIAVHPVDLKSPDPPATSESAPGLGVQSTTPVCSMSRATPVSRRGNWHELFSQMSAEFLADLSLLEAGMVTGCILLPPSPNSAAPPIMMPNYTGATPGNNAHYTVGRMLQSADRLLCALRELRGRTAPENPWSCDSTKGNTQSEAESTRNEVDARGYRFVPIAATAGSVAMDSGSLLHDQSKQPIDELLGLFIKTCHTTLLRICMGVYSLVLESLSHPPGRPWFEPLLPSIHLDGFQIGSQKQLQVNVMIQVTRRTLEEIEQVMCAVGLGLGPEHRGLGEGGILEDSIIKVWKGIQEYLANDQESP
ncbi:Zn(II)2Cys6 transcription factor domain-containing protein [Aspergillus stella-maris]|uniref:Zn(II)2Cys6 transcription factor domain-containing protein n=1 Tax=Aspergillus stella-maris TaxID=1810926 RepID=UPI003CCE44D2